MMRLPSSTSTPDPEKSQKVKQNRRVGISMQHAVGRWKRVIGDGLRFHTDKAQVTEVAIAVKVLNRMLDLGRPNSVRVA